MRIKYSTSCSLCCCCDWHTAPGGVQAVLGTANMSRAPRDLGPLLEEKQPKSE